MSEQDFVLLAWLAWLVPSGAFVIALLVGAYASAVAAGRADRQAETRAQIVNDHATNLREDLDDDA